MNSEELCGVFSIPTENIVGFEIQEIKRFAINYQSTTNEKSIGNICDYDCPINNHFLVLLKMIWLNIHLYVELPEVVKLIRLNRY